MLTHFHLYVKTPKVDLGRFRHSLQTAVALSKEQYQAIQGAIMNRRPVQQTFRAQGTDFAARDLSRLAIHLDASPPFPLPLSLMKTLLHAGPSGCASAPPEKRFLVTQTLLDAGRDGRVRVPSDNRLPVAETTMRGRDHGRSAL
jgi:hypothetical protein